MENKKTLYAKMDLFKSQCKQRGFWEENKPDCESEMAGMLALTKNSASVFGSTEKAFDFLLSVIDECKTSQELADKIADKIGVD